MGSVKGFQSPGRNESGFADAWHDGIDVKDSSRIFLMAIRPVRPRSVMKSPGPSLTRSQYDIRKLYQALNPEIFQSILGGARTFGANGHRRSLASQAGQATNTAFPLNGDVFIQSIDPCLADPRNLDQAVTPELLQIVTDRGNLFAEQRRERGDVQRPFCQRKKNGLAKLTAQKAKHDVNGQTS
jgi:hypothetical protein